MTPRDIRLASQDGAGTPNVVEKFDYAYNTASSPKYEARNVRTTVSHLYADGTLNRLTKFERGTLNSARTAMDTTLLAQDFYYDDLGNWTTHKPDASTTQDREYAITNELTRITVGGTPTDRYYDAGGELTKDASYSYYWDYRNRITRVTRVSDGAAIGDYKYDAMGRRIEKVVSNSGGLNGTSRLYWDGSNIVESRDGSANVDHHFIWGTGPMGQLVLIDHNADADTDPTEGSDNRLYASDNRIANVQGLFTYADSTTTLAERYEYNAYGQRLIYDANDTPISSSAYGNPVGFHGGVHDEETGKQHGLLGPYDPVTGHGLSRDSAGYVGGMNLYQYAQSAPVRIWGWPSDNDECGQTFRDDLQRCQGGPMDDTMRICVTKARCDLRRCAGLPLPRTCAPPPLPPPPPPPTPGVGVGVGGVGLGLTTTCGAGTVGGGGAVASAIPYVGAVLLGGACLYYGTGAVTEYLNRPTPMVPRCRVVPQAKPIPRTIAPSTPKTRKRPKKGYCCKAKGTSLRGGEGDWRERCPENHIAVGCAKTKSLAAKAAKKAVNHSIGCMYGHTRIVGQCWRVGG